MKSKSDSKMKNKTLLLSITLASLLTAGCSNSATKPTESQANLSANEAKKTTESATKPTNKVVLKSEVTWDYLNPKRADKAPMAATLWGDRKANTATGFLLKPKDGFQSPPHIHNVSYRGVVISGLIHNDDPNATSMWMPAGSFWTQPKGEVHITAAKGSNTLAYIEIEAGPYLVKPASNAFDSGERPVNVDKSNIVWLDASTLTWLAQGTAKDNSQNAEIAFVWGNPKSEQFSGSLIKLPAGFKGKIHSYGESFKAVVLQGTPEYQMPNSADISSLEPGSFFSSTGESTHQVSSQKSVETVLYVRSQGKFKVVYGK